MSRFAHNVGFLLIFVTVGFIAGFIVFWGGLILFAIGYEGITGSPFHAGTGDGLELVRLVVVLGTCVVTTAWLFRKQRRIRLRWDEGKYLNCLRCGYDLRGNTHATCPECGYKMTSAQLHELGVDDA